MARVLVVGSNRGIGLELVRQFARRGDSVFALCRNMSDDLKKVENTTVLEGFDVGQDSVISKLIECKELPDKFDVVVANAGVLERENFDSIATTDTMMKQFNVNSLGPLRVARGTFARLSEGSKFAIITSRMGSVADNGSGGMYGYRMSKSALNAAGKSLSVDWKKEGIPVGILHPGYVRTDMTGHNGHIDAAESAAGLIARIDELNISNTGTFWHMNGEILPW